MNTTMTGFPHLRRKLGNAFWEFRLGITTHGTAVTEFSDDEHIFYGTHPYLTTRNVLKSLSLNEHDTFVDLGSGKGRVTCMAALWHLREVIGVDDDPDMCAIARRNAERMRGRISPIRIEQTPAQNFDYTCGTVFYMFNPFGPRTLSVILQKLNEGLAARPRNIRIIYATPAHENLLQQSGWLMQYSRWSSSTHHFVDDVISFWTNKA